ncbi:hypothetical protein K466DRAFT_667871 [Polyporus arcularius HHB13444]|uniref:Uncharacterized protein n=1 Tax=Polyporus arcularius HHB13444 TaxID=1314778 RepID=A0A5C3NR52_9APHY|nr:hypothetical protein K466DRAFT_667871 [Polyporus arcularius HHB13444]
MAGGTTHCRWKGWRTSPFLPQPHHHDRHSGRHPTRRSQARSYCFRRTREIIASVLPRRGAHGVRTVGVGENGALRKDAGTRDAEQRIVSAGRTLSSSRSVTPNPRHRLVSTILVPHRPQQNISPCSTHLAIPLHRLSNRSLAEVRSSRYDAVGVLQTAGGAALHAMHTIPDL